MSELIVIGYDDHAKATQAYNEVITLQSDFVVELRGLAIVTRWMPRARVMSRPRRRSSVSARRPVRSGAC